MANDYRLSGMLPLLGFAIFLSGCGRAEELPATYPVSGQVRWDDGSPMQQGGTVLFQSADQTNLTVSGEIGADGSYSLTTSRADQQQPGAVPGEYRVTIVPTMGPEQTQPPIVLRQKVSVSAAENQIDLRLPQRPPR